MLSEHVPACGRADEAVELPARSCSAPVIVSAESDRSGHSPGKASPHGWSVRYWRVSSTLSSMSGPNVRRR